MDGGLISLCVEDDGTVSGVDPDAVERVKTDIAAAPKGRYIIAQGNALGIERRIWNQP
jgi:hypothetical protein